MASRVRLLVAVLLVALTPRLLEAQRQPRVVFVTATTTSGVPITDLVAADFVVLENGATRQVTRATVGGGIRIALLVDSSVPMNAQLPAFRAGLNSFLDSIPSDQEVVIISTGGQARVRQSTTTDAQKLHAAASAFTSDNGGNAMLDAILEADNRFLKNTAGRLPVMVILTTDAGSMLRVPDVEGFNKFVPSFVAKGGIAHAIVIRDQSTGAVTDFVHNLVENAGGIYDPVAISNSLPERMKAIGDRITANLKALAGHYAVEYTSEGKPTQVEVQVKRPGVVWHVVARPY